MLDLFTEFFVMLTLMTEGVLTTSTMYHKSSCLISNMMFLYVNQMPVQ